MKELRLEKHLTQEQLGDLCSPRLSRQAISAIEKGGNCDVTTLTSIAKALRVAPAALMEDSPQSGEALRLAEKLRLLSQKDRDVFFRALADMSLGDRKRGDRS